MVLSLSIRIERDDAGVVRYRLLKREAANSPQS